MPAPLGPTSTTGVGAAVEPELAVVAEIGQPELAHGQDAPALRRMRRRDYGRSALIGDSRHTRIGMST